MKNNNVNSLPLTFQFSEIAPLISKEIKLKNFKHTAVKSANLQVNRHYKPISKIICLDNE